MPTVIAALLLALLVLPLRVSGADAAAEGIPIEMALYYAPAPTADPLPAVRAWSGQEGWSFLAADADPAAAPPPAVRAKWVPLDQYAPPSEKSWRYRTRGLPAERRPALAAAERVLVLHFVVVRARATEANERIARLLAEVADRSGGCPWDEETRKLYAAEAWRASRVATWAEGVPDMREHLAIDAYRDGEFIRAVTLGMRKFGLPDIAAEGVTSHASRTIGHTINACAQVLVEGGRIADGRLALDFAAVRHPAVRASLQANPGEGATGRIDAILTVAKPAEGDADNALVALDFPTPGATTQERQQSAITQLFGSRDEITPVRKDDGELAAASAKARERLLALRERFTRGFEPGEHLTVKGPFTAEDGRVEWMWVEVSRWADGALHGTLVNQPFWVKRLQPGSPVQVTEGDVFDYIWTRADGSREGNETGAIIGRQQGGD